MNRTRMGVMAGVLLATTAGACAQIVGLGDWKDGSGGLAAGAAGSTSMSTGGAASTMSTSETSVSATSSGSMTTTVSSTTSTTGSGSSGSGGCTGVCLPTGPSLGNFHGPVQLAPPPMCPVTWAPDTTLGHAYQDPPNPCTGGCTCEAPIKGTCNYSLILYQGNMGCVNGTQTNVPVTNGCSALNGTNGYPAGFAMLMNQGEASPLPSCIAMQCGSTAPLTKEVCVPTSLPSCPSAQQACVPSGTKVCVWASGSATCPMAYPVVSTWYDNVADGSCACDNVATGSTNCNVSSAFMDLSSFACSQTSIPVSSGCSSLPASSTSYSIFVAPTDGGHCTSSTPTFQPGAKANAFTFCCTE
jgi:hypothetical protein